MGLYTVWGHEGLAGTNFLLPVWFYKGRVWVHCTGAKVKISSCLSLGLFVEQGLRGIKNRDVPLHVLLDKINKDRRHKQDEPTFEPDPMQMLIQVFAAPAKFALGSACEGTASGLATRACCAHVEAEKVHS